MEKRAWWESAAAKLAAKAEEVMVDPTAGRLTKLDAQGGAAGRTPEEEQKAQASDLLTLPINIPGANCANCRFVKMLDPEQGRGFCTNPALMMEVTERMLCANWDSPGTLRSWSVQDAANVPPQGMVDQMVAEDPGLMDSNAPSPADAAMDPAAAAPVEGAMPSPGPAQGALDPAGAQSGMPAASGQPAEEEAAADAAAVKPEKSKPKSEKKPAKSEKKDGNTINIHVGQEKKASFWGGFQHAAEL